MDNSTDIFERSEMFSNAFIDMKNLFLFPFPGTLFRLLTVGSGIIIGYKHTGIRCQHQR